MIERRNIIQSILALPALLFAGSKSVQAKSHSDAIAHLKWRRDLSVWRAQKAHEVGNHEAFKVDCSWAYALEYALRELGEPETRLRVVAKPADTPPERP